MCNKKTIVSLIAFAVTFLSCTPRAEGECCYSTLNGICPDCQLKNPGEHYCGAGAGGCNVVGCNCEGGCKTGDCRKARSVRALIKDGKQDTENVTGKDVVRWADSDGNGALDAREVKVFLARHGVLVEVDFWRTLDANNDGMLASHEIDLEDK